MWYDAIVIGILAYTTIRGAMKGVIWQIAAIAGVVLCLVFAESISAAAGPYVRLEPPLNNWVVMLGAYLVFSFISFALAKLLTEWLDKIKFGEFNRHLGALFGFVKGAVICLVLTFFIVTVSDSAREMLRNSRSGRVAAIVMDRLHPVMPERLHEALNKYIDLHSLDSPDLDLRHSDHDGHDHADGDHSDLSQVVLPAEFDDLMSKIPEDVRGEFRDVLLRSLQQSKPEAQPDLLNSLLKALREVHRPEDVTSLRSILDQPPDQLLAAVANWLGEPPPASTNTTGPTLANSTIPATTTNPITAAPLAGGDAAARRQQLLQAISAEFSTFPLSQKRIQDDIQQQLANLPDGIALAVLADWQADLAIASPRRDARAVIQDPDPTTTAATLLPDRITRQTAAADTPAIPTTRDEELR